MLYKKKMRKKFSIILNQVYKQFKKYIFTMFLIQGGPHNNNILFIKKLISKEVVLGNDFRNKRQKYKSCWLREDKKLIPLFLQRLIIIFIIILNSGTFYLTLTK